MIALFKEVVVGGIVKGRSEREGEGRNGLGSGVHLSIKEKKKQKTFFPVDLESSLIVYSSP